MQIIIKNFEEIILLRESGKILAETLKATANFAKEGMSTLDLDIFAETFIKERGGKPAFKGYHGFPGTLCTSINEEIVHGIPSADRILKNGDLLTIDCGVSYKGLITDSAISIGIGEISAEKEKLIKTADEALSRAIDTARPGIHLSELSKVIEKTVKDAGFHVIRDLTGHGVGRQLHEDPIILNFFDGNPGPTLKPGMTIAIEPIFSSGTSEMKELDDNWTLVTIDNSCAVQKEHTILITEDGNNILTKI